MAKLHHNKEFMEIALARQLPPRGMQLDLSCTLLNKTPTIEEQWDKILLKASIDLVKLSFDHYMNQVEVELKQQKVLLQEIRELSTHHNLTSAENSTLTGLVKTTMAKHQTETATLAAQLAAKRNGGNKRRRENQSPPPPQQSRTNKKTGFKKQEDKDPGEAQHQDTSKKTERPALKKRRRKKHNHMHNRKRPHHRTYTHIDTCIQSHNICNLSNALTVLGKV